MQRPATAAAAKKTAVLIRRARNQASTSGMSGSAACFRFSGQSGHRPIGHELAGAFTHSIASVKRVWTRNVGSSCVPIGVFPPTRRNTSSGSGQPNRLRRANTPSPSDGGGIGKSGSGTLTVDGKKVGEGHIELTQALRFSLDESFDVGEDTGSPVIDEYDAKMPFKFSGTLSNLDVDLGPDQLTPQKRGELERLKSDFAMRNQ
jgi:hypothetical protein